MGTSDPPIIITGGSVTIDFDESEYPKDGNNKRSNPNKKIKRVEITGDGINISQDIPNGKCTIKIHIGK